MITKAARVYAPLSLLLLIGLARGFAPVSPPPAKAFIGLGSSTVSTLEAEKSTSDGPQDDESDSIVVRAPLKFMGPYPTISLRFPNLATAAQRQRNVSGISLDFVVDTAANVNTINGQVAQELALGIVGQAASGVSATGPMKGASTFSLGDAELERAQFIVENQQKVEEEDEQEVAQTNLRNETFTFMTNLTASALPVANPFSAGLLSLSFLQCFQGGVEFGWGQYDPKEKKVLEYPSVSFHENEITLPAETTTRKNAATITPVPLTNLPSIMINVNGVKMPALLDTGSPLTVLNSAAAQAAGIAPKLSQTTTSNKKNQGFFAKLQNRLEEGNAARRGELLTVAGPNGSVQLVQSAEPVRVAVVGDEQEIELGHDPNHVYVGDLPGLAALNGLGVDSPPAVVLGMDVLQKRPKMLLRANQNKVYFY